MKVKVKMSSVLCSLSLFEGKDKKDKLLSLFGTSLGTLSVSSVRRKPCLSMDAKKTKLTNHLVEIRNNLVTDRVKEKSG